MHAFTMKEIDVGIYFSDRCLFKRNIQPQDILPDNVQIVFYRMLRVIATLQMPSEVNNHIGYLHRFLPSGFDSLP
jgi:hypothetical protein